MKTTHQVRSASPSDDHDLRLSDQRSGAEREVPRTLAGWPPWAIYVPRTPVDTRALFRAQLEREKHELAPQRWDRQTRQVLRASLRERLLENP